jgi:hypothetical protein
MHNSPHNGNKLFFSIKWLASFYLKTFSWQTLEAGCFDPMHTPAHQIGGPEFKPQYLPKKR